MLVVCLINLISIKLEIKSFKTISGDEVTLRRQTLENQDGKSRISSFCLLIFTIVLRAPSAFSSPLILRGYQPLIDLVRNAMPSLTFGPSRRDSARSIIVGRGFFSCPPEKCGGFFSERFGFSSTLIRLGILIFTDWIVVSFE